MFVVVVAGDFHAQLDYLSETELHIGDNCDCLIHVCCDHRLSLLPQTLGVKGNIGSSRAFICFHMADSRLTMLSSVVGGVNQPIIFDPSNPIVRTRIMLWSVLAFFAPSLWSQNHVRTTDPRRYFLA